MKKYKIIRIILIIIWMIIVFSFSNENGEMSSNKSKTITKVVVEKVVVNKTPQEKENIIDNIEKVVRKLAHYTLYMIGGFLIFNYIDTCDKQLKYKIIYSTISGAIYATTDELHQFFIGGRSAQITDVGIDTLGVITGIIIYLCLKRIIKK